MGKTNLDSRELKLPLQAIDEVCFYIAGIQTAGVKKAAVLVGFAGEIVGVRAHLDTAPTGAAFVIDVNKNGTTLFTTQANRPTVAISGTDSTTTLPDVVSVAAGDRLSIDVDVIGSTVPGSDLYVTVSIKRATVQE